MSLRGLTRYLFNHRIDQNSYHLNLFGWSRFRTQLPGHAALDFVDLQMTYLDRFLILTAFLSKFFHLAPSARTIVSGYRSGPVRLTLCTRPQDWKFLDRSIPFALKESFIQPLEKLSDSGA